MQHAEPTLDSSLGHDPAIARAIALGASSQRGAAGPLPAPVPVASAWEWGVPIAVALDGRPLSRESRASRRAGTAREVIADRTAMAIVALLATAAAILSALLI